MVLQISNIPPSVKTTANSVANFVYNLLGYLPAPYVYGFVYDKTGGGKSIWGMFSLQCSAILVVLLMIILLIKKKRDEVILKKQSHLAEPLKTHHVHCFNEFD